MENFSLIIVLSNSSIFPAIIPEICQKVIVMMRIETTNPEKILRDDALLQSLIPLILGGYVLVPEELADPLASVKSEYDQHENNKHARVFLAREGEEVIGSLIMVEISSSEAFDAFPGKRIFEIAGIVVQPDYRKNGVASKLMQQALDALQPDVIVGLTNSPAAVMFRTMELASKGYQTFCGSWDVSSFPIRSSEEHSKLLSAYLSHHKFSPKDLLSNLCVSYDEYGLAPVDQNTEYPSELAEIFEELIRLQADHQKTLLLPVISVKYS